MSDKDLNDGGFTGGSGANDALAAGMARVAMGQASADLLPNRTGGPVLQVTDLKKHFPIRAGFFGGTTGYVVELSAGDSVVLYTDGVLEARGPMGWYGEDRLRELVESLAGSAPDIIAERVLAESLAFQEDRPRDDIAIVAVTVD